MGIIEAYKALKDIKYRVSTNNKPLQILEAKENHVMICKGDTCFELFKPEKNGKSYIVPVIKWNGNGSKFKSMEKKYIPLSDLNYYMNSSSFKDFAEKVKQIKEVEEDQARLLKLFDYLNLMFI
jgi:CRISPR/Cas system-associated protein Cas5 (RAMP superfamily)